jgi:hypothetical protein
VTNLCRDEVTAILKDKIEAVWGGSFNVNGLGGVLTCGVTGFGAGLSHAPVCAVSRDWVSDTRQLSGHQQAAGAFCAGVTEFGSHMLFFWGLLGGTPTGWPQGYQGARTPTGWPHTAQSGDPDCRGPEAKHAVF